MEKIKVEAEEILFFQKNAPANFTRIVHDNLKDGGVAINRMQVHRELTTHKKEYLKPVIDEGRRVIEALKGLRYTPNQN